MSKPKVFEKPIGVRDYLPHIVRRLRLLQGQVLTCMERWGYHEIMTPTLEYFETVGAASTTSESKQFKLLDAKGRTLVLRSDMTAPIARVAGSLLKDEPLPLRLAYHANVFRAPEEEAGRDAEFFQTGVELIGDDSIDADAEVIALAVACLESSGLQQFDIVLGHSGYLQGLMSECLDGREAEQIQLTDFLLKRNHVGYSHMLQQMNLRTEHREALTAILRLRGDFDVCRRARELTTSVEAHAAITQIEAVFNMLRAYDVTERLTIDLTMVGDFSYYTGITFEGYAVDQAFPVCSGGRYDLLLQQFGRTAPATGFALKTNRILELLGKQSADGERFDPRRVLVLYDDEHRKDAIEHARSLRNQLGPVVAVHTSMVEERLVQTDEMQLDTLKYKGKVYDEIITFLGVRRT